MSEKTTENTPLKRSIDDLDLFDLPMVGIFKDKKYTAYTLSTLAGIEVENLDMVREAVEAGADILVAGSAVFGAADPAAAVQHLASL